MTPGRFLIQMLGAQCPPAVHAVPVLLPSATRPREMMAAVEGNRISGYSGVAWDTNTNQSWHLTERCADRNGRRYYLAV